MADGYSCECKYQSGESLHPCLHLKCSSIGGSSISWDSFHQPAQFEAALENVSPKTWEGIKALTIEYLHSAWWGSKLGKKEAVQSALLLGLSAEPSKERCPTQAHFTQVAEKQLDGSDFYSLAPAWPGADPASPRQKALYPITKPLNCPTHLTSHCLDYK